MFPTALIPVINNNNRNSDSNDETRNSDNDPGGENHVGSQQSRNSTTVPPSAAKVESTPSGHRFSSAPGSVVFPAVPAVFIPTLKRSSTESSDVGGHSQDFRGSNGNSTGVRFCSPPGWLNEEDSVVESFHVRSQSSQSCHSTVSSSPSSVGVDICRICHCEATPETPLITPCYCAGSLKYVHQKCLQQWIKSSQTRSCEVCRYSFHMQTKLKPFTKWEKLDISSVERRKILCSVTFHVIAITCVVWSLYVLIDRTAEEIRDGQLDWPFWTKLVVVAIGFTGGLVFMYVQCKMYVTLFRRWRSYNKVIYVQNCPEAADRASRAGKRKGLQNSPQVITDMKTQRTVTVTGT